jgi:hypothetical protein
VRKSGCTIGTGDAPPDGVSCFRWAVTAFEMCVHCVHVIPTAWTSAEFLTSPPFAEPRPTTIPLAHHRSTGLGTRSAGGNDPETDVGTVTPLPRYLGHVDNT